MNVDFTYVADKLKVQFQNLSVEGTNHITWYFGDGATSQEINPSHEYPTLGRYRVKLEYRDGQDIVVGESTQTIMVSDKVNTTLSDTIYFLINTYLPSEIFGDLDNSLKKQLIQKWQLYLYPLVNHKIENKYSYNELYYEALENQLIMELAAYDYMVLKVNLMVQAFNSSLTERGEESEGSSSGEEGDVKHITTGPSEVEFFDSDDFNAKALASIIKAMNPDGVIDLMKRQICMLAERLDIYLPICQRLPKTVIAPKVVNRREHKFLGGPDPLEIINR